MESKRYREPIFTLFVPMNVACFQTYKPVLRRQSPSLRLDPDGLAWRNGLLVRAPNWLGDTLMCLPAVRQLRRFVPEPCGLFVLCPEALASVWQAAPWVSAVIGMRGRRLAGAEARLVHCLQPGIGLVLPHSFGAAWDLARTGVPVRIGRGGRARALLLRYRIPAWSRTEGQGAFHELSHYLELVSVFGAVAWDAGQSALMPPADRRECAARLGMSSGRGEKWLVLAPGAAYGPAKQWPLPGFCAVADEWLADGGRVVVVGTAREGELATALSHGRDGVLNLAGRTGLAELMAVLSSATMVVANDSGVMHLAAGLGTPGVAVYGSTDPVATGPLGAPWVILQEAIECAPCFGRTCRRVDTPYACLERVRPDAVLRAIAWLRAQPIATGKGGCAARAEG